MLISAVGDRRYRARVFSRIAFAAPRE